MDTGTVLVSAVVSIATAVLTAVITTRIQMRAETAKWWRDFTLRFVELQSSNPDQADRLAAQFAVGFVVVTPEVGERDRYYIRSEGVAVIGRAPSNDIPISDPSLSRRHAEIRTEGRIAYLRDLGSSNGTCVNGRRVIREPVRLSDGDAVQVGQVSMTYHSL
jgi:pSer/pThr/pTyr-binding forkhead associated (FHA) protein